MFWPSYVAIPTLLIISQNRPFGVSLSSYYAIIPVLLSGTAAALRVRYRGLADQALPSIEDKTLVFFRRSVHNLGAFVQNHSESYRSNCLDNLRTAAHLIDKWNPGNLRFTESQLGTKLSDFQKAFRLRLIPTLEKADDKTASEVYNYLSIAENNWLLAPINPTRLDSWNAFLSRFSEVTRGRYVFHGQDMKTPLYQGAYLAFVVIAAYLYFTVLRDRFGADFNTATSGLNAVLTIGLTPYAGFLFWKLISRERAPKS